MVENDASSREDATDDESDDLKEISTANGTGRGEYARFRPPFDGAVWKVGENDEMFVRCKGNSGLLRSTSNWFSCTIKSRKWPINQSKPKSQNFRLIPLRVQFAIVWNSIYKAFGSFNGFKGAEDIKNCMLWLTIVSVLTTTLIVVIHGPCVPVKEDDGTRKDPTNQENKIKPGRFYD